MQKKLLHELNTFYKVSFNDLSAEEIKEIDFLNAVKKRFSFHRNAKYSIEQVSIHSIKPLTKFVYNFRLEKANCLLQKYFERNIALLKPIILGYQNKVSQIVAPPILEVHKKELVLCDGTHRVYKSLLLGLEKIYCLVVRNVNIPLPGEVNEWRNIKMLEKEVAVKDNFINFKAENLTGYTWIFNSEKAWLKQTEDVSILDTFANSNS